MSSRGLPVAGLVILTLLTAACTASGSGATIPLEVPEFDSWQEWADWRRDLNNGIEQEAALAWLTDNGFEIYEADENCDNIFYFYFEPTVSGEIPQELLEASSDCWDATQVGIPGFQTAELPYWYEVHLYVYECITRLNYDIPPPPTLEAFTAALNDPEAEDWVPEAPRNVLAVEQICPSPYSQVFFPADSR